MEQFDNSSVEFSEFIEDPSLQQDEYDELNDETFGSSEPIYEHIEKFRPKTELPAFFSGQENEDFAEESLEPTGKETSLEEELHYSTAHRWSHSDDFFFSEAENEANAQLDSQMESMFTTVLDDGEEEVSHLSAFSKSSASIPITKTRSANELEQQGFSPLSREAAIWKSDVSNSPDTSGTGFWNNHSGTAHTNITPPHTLTKSSSQQDVEQNPLAKFFGAAVVQQMSMTAPQPTAAPLKMLSVEEIESKLKSTSINAATAPRPQPNANYPVNQPLPMPSMPPHQQLPAHHLYPQHPQQLPHTMLPPHLLPTHQQLPQQLPQQQYPQQQFPQQPYPQQQYPQQQQQHAQQAPPAVFSPEQFPALSKQQQAQPQGHSQSSAQAAQVQQRTPPRNIPQSNQGSSSVAYSPQNRTLHNFSQAHSPSRNTSPQRYRPRWKESKQMMSAEEIDSIIRMQESQLNSAVANQFAEDYYYLMQRQKPEEGLVTLHKPLFESSTKPSTLRKPDSLEGVLGRIPSHSVRAPRPLLQLKKEGVDLGFLGDINTSNNSNASSKVVQSLLLTVENAFNLLLDIQDIELILKHAASQNHFNIAYLRAKREEFTHELFKSIHVYIPPVTTLPQRTDNSTFIYPEDDIFINLTLVQKGKKLITKALPLFFPQQVLAIFFVYLRNLALLVTSPRLEMDLDSSNKLFALIIRIINSGNLSQTILSLQMILAAHFDNQLVKILQSKFGLQVIQALLKRGHDLNLSFFSREDALPPEMQYSQIVSMGYHWKEIIKLLFARIKNYFVTLFDSEIGHTNKIWEFFAVLVVNINQEQKRVLLTEIRDVVRNTPQNPILAGFLQLAGENVPKDA